MVDRGVARITIAAVAAALLMTVTPAVAHPADRSGPFSPGAAGVGDAYYPLAGNGGYDVGSYTLRLR
jgi:hypothetical protein